MQHHEAIAAVREILPEIKRLGSAEAAILNYADTRKLASAQVVKLAQVLNTARTLSFLERHPEDRSADHPVLDPDALVASYEKMGHTTKQASVSVGAPVQGRVIIPNFVKAASGLDVPATKVKVETDPTYLEMEAREFDKKKRDEVDDAKIESGEAQVLAESDAQEAKKAYAALRERCMDLPFEQIEEDAMLLGCDSPEAKMVIEKLATDLTGFYGRPNPRRCTAPDPTRKLAWDRYGVVALIKKVAENEKFYKEARAYADHLKKVAGPAGAATQADPSQQQREQHGHGGHGGGRGGKDRGKQRDRAGEIFGMAPAPNYDNLFKTVIKHPKAKDEEAEVPKFDSLDHASAAIRDALGLYPDAKTQIGSVVGSRDEPGVLSGIFADEAPHKRQRHIDEKVRDTRHVAALQKIMLTDPILREADPDRLVELYNDISAVKPDIANTPQQLAFQLREALQYGGMPSSSAKTLAETDKAQQDAATRRLGLENAQYGIPQPR